MRKMIMGIAVLVIMSSLTWAATYSISTDASQESDLAFWASYLVQTQEQVLQQYCGEGLQRAQRLRSQIESEQAMQAFLSASPEVQSQVRVLLGLEEPPE